MGHRRCVRGAVPAVLGNRSLRRCATGPLGPAHGADLCQPDPRTAGGPRRYRAGLQRRRRGAAAGRADRQRGHPVRDIGSLGGTPPCGAPRPGRDHELGGHRGGRHRHLRRRQLHADAAGGLRGGGLGFCHSHFPGDRADPRRGMGGHRLSGRSIGSRRQCARRARLGLLCGSHRVATWCTHHCRHALGVRRAHRSSGTPHGFRYQHVAGPGAGARQRLPVRGDRGRGIVPGVHRHRLIPRNGLHPCLAPALRPRSHPRDGTRQRRRAAADRLEFVCTDRARCRVRTRAGRAGDQAVRRRRHADRCR